ncbi:uncharacterized protein DUF1302 [Limnobacter thiooxidans]|uniref:DUF1302 domain-containing protein n=1 Tax=Limnobacter thiooxidans TaxID=131080 RepID=A0AA86IXZ8_9BURK|nr:DUF1302 domain-containing protein [Limnobacter sp.]MCZ8014061.1 DUF1302 domain-containing protein [Limnobacter sp.]RZS38245.1 uncharacterized protein DUF1302 [Limnobacter thiooxidans]BET25308.1 DUF1302 domain-containing protein [Limnobacter thiooxidans]
MVGFLPKNSLLKFAVAAALVSMQGGAVAAGAFEGPAGIEGRWAMEVTVGASMRMKDADKSLIFIGNGGTASSGTVDDGNLNYQKGDVFNAVAKAVGELELKKDNYGLFVRAKAFSDFHNRSNRVAHGSSNNGFRSNEALNDDGFDKGTKFEDAQFLDAYVFADFEPLGKPLTLKVGNQVVTWGEALFILGGVNQYSNFDSAALRRPGAQLKEVFLPIPQIYANLQATETLSLEGFVQLNHEKVVADGCGTFFSQADLLNCNFQGAPINPGVLSLGGANIDFTGYNDQQTFSGGGTINAGGLPINTTLFSGLGPLTNLLGGLTGLPADLSSLNFRMAQLADGRPKDSGQAGLAARYYAGEIGTEFGAYFVNYHQRIPALSLVKTPSGISNSAFNGIGVGGQNVVNPLSYFFDYSKENIQVAGLSAATELFGYSVFGEISYTKDYPAGYNTADLLKGGATGDGPLGRYGDAAQFPVGSVLQGYKPLDKIQAQISTIALFPRRLGASQVAVVGELGAQMWRGIGDPFTGERFGRSPAFGAGSHITYNGGNCDAAINPNPRNCTVDGYATETAFGYRILTALTYPDALFGVTLIPRLFFSHDFKGFSADGVFLEDRMNLGLGLRAEMQSAKYFAEMNYSMFNDKAYFDPFKDRDFLSLVVGANL